MSVAGGKGSFMLVDGLMLYSISPEGLNEREWIQAIQYAAFMVKRHGVKRYVSLGFASTASQTPAVRVKTAAFLRDQGLGNDLVMGLVTGSKSVRQSGIAIKWNYQLAAMQVFAENEVKEALDWLANYARFNRAEAEAAISQIRHEPTKRAG